MVENRDSSNLLHRKQQELDAAQRISEALFQNLSVAELVEQGLHIAMEVVGCRAGSVLLAKPETKELQFYHSVGERPPKSGMSFPWSEGIAGAVFARNELIVIEDVKKDRRHFGEIDLITGFHTQDVIALPLKRWEGPPIGVLEVLNKTEGLLQKEDVPILTIIAAFMALSIEQARLFQEAKLAEVARILGDIGHDVKNLLIPVLGGTSRLKEHIDDMFAELPELSPVKAEEHHKVCDEVIDMVASNAQRIQDRVKEVADCVKGLTSPPQFAPCKVHHAVASVFDALKIVAQEKGITLRHEGIQELPEITADEARLFNALYNLVNNAVSEVPSGGTITIKGQVEQGGKILHVSVIDNGRGMPEDVRRSLFTAKAISRKKGGIGLGTKIVKDIVEAHGGVIRVESEMNVGTTFHIQLPMGGPKASSSSGPLP